MKRLTWVVGLSFVVGAFGCSREASHEQKRETTAALSQRVTSGPCSFTAPPTGGTVTNVTFTVKTPTRGANVVIAGQSYQKHMGRDELPSVAGRDLNSAGQDLLEDEILTNPQTEQTAVRSGNFDGGTRFIGPNGVGATFDANGVFRYFGVYP